MLCESTNNFTTIRGQWIGAICCKICIKNLLLSASILNISHKHIFHQTMTQNNHRGNNKVKKEARPVFRPQF